MTSGVMTREKELLESLKARNMLPQLQSSRILCWYSNLQWIGDYTSTLSTFLSPEEVQQADFLEGNRLAERYVTSHGLLRLLLAHYCQKEVSSIQIESNFLGKPILNDQRVHFNLSHSDDGFCIALSSTSEIGIDLEKIRALDDLDQLIEANFTEKEEIYVRAVENRTLERFFQLWTVKESYLKYTGDGVRIDPKTIEFNCSQDDFSISTVTGLMDHFSSDTWPLDMEAGYVAAITVEAHQQVLPPIQLNLI